MSNGNKITVSPATIKRWKRMRDENYHGELIAEIAGHFESELALLGRKNEVRAFETIGEQIADINLAHENAGNLTPEQCEDRYALECVLHCMIKGVAPEIADEINHI